MNAYDPAAKKAKRSLLQRLIPGLVRPADRNVSIIELLSKFMSTKQLERVVSITPDRRHVVAAAAQELGLAEEALLIEVARKARMTFLGRVLPMDLSVLRDGLAISSFRQTGSIAVTSSGVVTGIVCVDPTMARGVRALLPEVPVYLSAWSAIAKALDESERLFMKKNEAIAKAAGQKIRDAALKAVGLIISHAETNKQCAVEITLSEQEATFSFSLVDGKEARGRIHDKLREAMPSLLREWAGQNPMTFPLPGGAVRNGVSVEFSEAVQQALLSWKMGAAPVILPAAESEAPVAPSSISNSSSNVIPFPSPGQDSRIEGGSNLPKAVPSIDQMLKRELGPEDIKHHVLLVDDNATFAKVLERFFSRQATRTQYADSAEKALTMLLDEGMRPDLIVCDVHMTGMTGLEFIGKARGCKELADIPVIMLTSDTDIEMELKLLGQGADAFIGKNEDPRLLCVQAKRLIEQAARRKKAA